MPTNELPWRVVFQDKGQDQLDEYMEMSKTVTFRTRNKSTCTVCSVVAAGEAHNMVYQLLWCASTTCQALTAIATCKWRAKILTCEVTGLVCVYELYSHIETSASPKKNQLTRAMRQQVRTLAKQDTKPAKIRNTLIQALQLTKDTAPRLLDVQNCVANFRRQHMSNDDYVETMIKLANEYARGPENNEEDPLAFGFEYDAYNKPIIGTGKDDNPFLFGLTTLALVRLLDSNPEEMIFHVDSTFKLNQSSYPVLVCGISGQRRSFQLVAFFVMSHRTEAIHNQAFRSLALLFYQLTRRHLRIKYVMGDGDDAQYNAVLDVFGAFSEVTYLMCFYHVIAKVQEKSRSFPPELRQKVFRYVYEMHYARCQADLENALEKAWTSWAAHSDTVKFGQYFYKQWLRGKFMRWQCYHTPIGFAKTNNPVEQFNKVIKRDYTLRVRLKVGNLLEKLAACCRKHSVTDDRPEVSRGIIQLKRRMRLLVKCNKLHAAASEQTQMSNMDEDSHVHVVSMAFSNQDDMLSLSTKEQDQLEGSMNYNNSRMEYWKMGEEGWEVNTVSLTCRCSYFYKFGSCVHVLFALEYKNLPMPWDRQRGQRLVNKKKRKRQREFEDVEAPQPGRPPIVGFALSFD
jgi:hypothetical protein